MAAPTDQRPRTPTGTLVARTTIVAALATVPLFMVVYFTGVGGLRGGWLWAGAVSAAAGAGLGWLAWGAHPGRRAATAAVALAAVAFGTWVGQQSPWSTGRLRARMDAVAVPATWEKVEDTSGGNWLCWDVCTSLGRRWVAPGTADEVRAQVSDVLARQGFTLGPWRQGSQGRELLGRTVRRGPLRGWVGVEPRWVQKDLEHLPLPEGHVSVELIVESA